MTNFEKIKQFHQKFGGQELSLDQLLDLRQKLINEEYDEVSEALTQFRQNPECPQMKAELLKELADLLYVVYGTILELDVDADLAFGEVHESNMSKMRSNSGKAIKGEGYYPANMTKFV